PEIPVTPENSYSLVMQRLAIDSPQLREIAGRPELSQHARRNLERFLSSAGTTSERYGAVLRSPEAVERALDIFEFSEYLTDILVRHPAEVSLLERIAEIPTSEAAELFDDGPQTEPAMSDPVFAYLAPALPPPRLPVRGTRSVPIAPGIRFVARQHCGC